MRTRLGVVSFLNTKPLVYALETGEVEHGFEFFYDVPSVCAERLHAGDLDVALIPTIEIARGPEPYGIVPGVGLASRDSVRSVLLLLNKEPGDVKTVALDTSSRTSVALARIVLDRCYGARPRTFARPPEPVRMLEEADAALVIGDRALELDRGRFRALDLGGAWTAMTGLPFVYACWTGRRGSLPVGGGAALRKAKAAGLARLPEIAAAFARGRAFDAAFYEAYLRDNMRYEVGGAELEGMGRFFAYAEEVGEIESAPDPGLLED